MSKYKLFKWRIPIGKGLYWIGFYKGKPLFRKNFRSSIRFFPNDTEVFNSLSNDGHITFQEGGSCTGTNDTNTVANISDNHTTTPLAIQQHGMLEFDTSTLSDDATVTSASVNTFADNYSKSSRLAVTWNVNYYSEKVSLSDPLACGDHFLITSEGSLNWNETTGGKVKSIAASSINLTGSTSIELRPGWAHLASGKFATVQFRTSEHVNTLARPNLTVEFTLPATGFFLSRLALLGAG